MLLWIKSLHIIFMVTWFAGIFYLPRLFVYHSMTEDVAGNERFKTMERKLYRGIMMPSMVLTLVFGFWLYILNLSAYIHDGWMHVKLTLVFFTVLYHFYCGYLQKKFANDENTHGHVFYRVINEIPVIMLIGIVIMVVVQPF